jgi:hypothetical protein
MVAPGKIDPLQRREPERLVFQRGVLAHSVPPPDFHHQWRSRRSPRLALALADRAALEVRERGGRHTTGGGDRRVLAGELRGAGARRGLDDTTMQFGEGRRWRWVVVKFEVTTRPLACLGEDEIWK